MRGILTVYQKPDHRRVDSFTDLSEREAQQLLDARYPRDTFYGIYMPMSYTMEATS